MDPIGRKLLMLRKQRKLSLRQVERLTTIIANKHNDRGRRVSASWLGRIERENHSLAHKRLESLEEVYGVSHEELIDVSIPDNDAARSLQQQLPDIPGAVLRGLTECGGPLLPPENWLAYFPETTLLPAGRRTPGTGSGLNQKYPRGAVPLFGVIGANDKTLVPFVQPGAIVEINRGVRAVEAGKVFHSIFERPIYFLRSHEGYHCGWCELDVEEQWLSLLPSAMTTAAYRRWKYRQEVEILGIVNRVLTRLGFPDALDYGHEAVRKPAAF